MGFPHSKILKQACEVIRDNKFLWVHGLFLFWGRTAIIVSVKALLEKKEAGLGRGLKQARCFSRRVMASFIILYGVLIVIFVTLALPTFYLYTESLFDRAVLLGSFGLCIFIPAAVALAMLDILSANFICFYDQGPKAGLAAGWDLLVKKLPTLLVFSALLWLAVLIAFVTLLFVVFLIVLVFSGSLAWTFGVLISVSSLAIIRAFHQTAWTLAFMELVKPVKFEREEIVPAPEMA